MAVYKVPQDVEAEDKLLGPFSFRQFIYLSVAIGGIVVGVFLFRIFPGLIIVPLPIVILFGALALPLRKDQPMEIYLLAIARYYLKPKRRVWNPDGTVTNVEIIAPPAAEEVVTKGLTQETAQERLDYLAKVMDTRGWALKGVGPDSNNIRPEAALEARDTSVTSDIMDPGAGVAKSFDDLIAQRKQADRERLMQAMRTQPQPASIAPQVTLPPEPTLAAPSPIQPTPTFTQSVVQPVEPTAIAPQFNPYPTAMHQRVIQPAGARPALVAPAQPQPTVKPAQAMTAQVSPDIMRLANNPDLSVSVIAREAHRLRQGDEGEVVISPRKM